MPPRRTEFWISALSSRLNLLRRGYSHGVSLGYLERSGCRLVNDPRAALVWLFPQVGEEALEQALSQARTAVDVARSDEGADVRPALERWNIERFTAELLAAIVLIQRPRQLVEVGVANGTSTRVLLSALEVAGDGELLSFDIDARCARVVSPQLASRWQFELLPPGRVKSLKELERHVGNLDEVDLWFSDADHSYPWQKSEWILALRSLGDRGILIADDIDATPAWHAATEGRETARLVDSRKVTGVTRVGRVDRVTT